MYIIIRLVSGEGGGGAEISSVRAGEGSVDTHSMVSYNWRIGVRRMLEINGYICFTFTHEEVL